MLHFKIGAQELTMRPSSHLHRCWLQVTMELKCKHQEINGVTKWSARSTGEHRGSLDLKTHLLTAEAVKKLHEAPHY